MSDFQGIEEEYKRALDYLSSPLAKFEPWEFDGRAPQREFAASFGRSKLPIFRAGNQSGKTYAGGFITAALAHRRHPLVPAPRPVRGWVSGLSWAEIGRVMWPAIKRFLDPRAIDNIAWFQRKTPEIPRTIDFCDGSRLEFLSAKSGREHYQGAAIDFCWVDEEQPAAIIEEIRVRLLSTDGHLYLTLTPVKRSRHIADIEAEPGVDVTRASSMDAGRAGILKLAAVERLAAALPDAQRRVRIEGDHARHEGVVYPEFDRQTHCVYVDPRKGRLVTQGGTDAGPVPIDSAAAIAAIDFGYSVPTAVPRARELPGSNFPDGITRYLIDRCWYAPFIRASRWADHLNDNLGPLVMDLIADHDAAERAELRAKGIQTVAARKAITPGTEAVSRMLFLQQEQDLPRLLFLIDPELRDPFTGRCDAMPLVREIENYSYKQDSEGNYHSRDLPEDGDDHACDALRYLVREIELGLTRRGALDYDLTDHGPVILNPMKDTMPKIPRGLLP